MQGRLTKAIIPLTLFLIICFYCLTTFIENTYAVTIYSWTKYLLAIPFVFCLTMLTKWTKKSISRKLIVIVAIFIIVFSSHISDRLFLGHQTAYTYLGQDAGFEELYLFDSGKCKLTYGGILGVRERHYGTYQIKDSFVLVNIRARLLDLEQFRINLKDKNFTIRAKEL